MPTRRPVLRSSFVEGFFHDLEAIDGPGAADWQASLTQRLLGLAALGLDGHERRIGRMVLPLRGREGMLYVLYWRRDGYFRPALNVWLLIYDRTLSALCAVRARSGRSEAGLRLALERIRAADGLGGAGAYLEREPRPEEGR